MSERWIVEPNARRGAWIMNSESGEWTALACGDTDKSAAQHARLIAAAPELLEALTQALGVLDGMTANACKIGLEGTPEWDQVAGAEDIYGVVDKCRAAIETATS